MINLKKIDKLQEDYLTNLTVPELKEYILNLSIEYYSSLASKDYDKVNLIIGTFEKIIDLNSNYDVRSYISFCLINVFNKLIINSDAVNLKEPVLTNESKTDNKFMFTPTDLEKVVSYYKFEKIHKRTVELTEANLTVEEDKDLFNFNDYYIGRS